MLFTWAVAYNNYFSESIWINFEYESINNNSEGYIHVLWMVLQELVRYLKFIQYSYIKLGNSLGLALLGIYGRKRGEDVLWSSSVFIKLYYYLVHVLYSLYLTDLPTVHAYLACDDLRPFSSPQCCNRWTEVDMQACSCVAQQQSWIMCTCSTPGFLYSAYLCI